VTWLLVVIWLASLGVDWPQFPGGARLADVLFVPAALAVFRGDRLRVRLRRLDALVIAYVAAGSVGLIVSSNRAATLMELGRHAYLAVIYGVVAAAIVGGLGAAVRSGLTLMGTWLAITALGLAVWFRVQPVDLPAIGEVMVVPYAGDVLRLRALTASPTMFACLLTMALPFAIAGRMQASDRVTQRLLTGALVLMGTALVMTFSHVWAGAALAVTIAAWPLLAGRRLLRAASVVVVVALTLVFNASLVAAVRTVSHGSTTIADRGTYPYAVDEGRIEVAGYTVDYAVMSYARIKRLALETFLSHPLTGVGLDRFSEVSGAAYQQGRLPHMYRVIDPHSALLGRLAETGILGGVTLVLLWVAVLGTGARLAGSSASASWDARAALAGVAGLLVAGINVDIMNFRFVWAAFGVLRGLSELRSQAADG
jgi:hypothetical protein